ncbi:MAG: hypothetical protein HY347_12125 [candidate division NC10 bacterium]|nr:hypothetical protein [candidate division NC10 bacterium]
MQRKSEGERADFLVGLVLAGVVGFNLTLAYANLAHGRLGWGLVLFVFGVLIPGAILFLNVVDAFKKGDLSSRWRDLVAAGIGALNCLAILAHWSDGLRDLSWVTIFIILNVLAFILMSRTA